MPKLSSTSADRSGLYHTRTLWSGSAPFFWAETAEDSETKEGEARIAELRKLFSFADMEREKNATAMIHFRDDNYLPGAQVSHCLSAVELVSNASIS